MSEDKKIIIDASHGVLGRVAAFAAKQALLGKDVVVVGCEHAVITGSKNNIVANYKQKRARGGSAMNGPHINKTPARLIKRTIRGMLPYKFGRGLAAFKRIKCYDGMPTQFVEAKKHTMHANTTAKTMTLEALAKIV